MSQLDKVYIHLIDGSEAYAPINARCIKDDLYEILNDEDYDDSDSSQLFEFYPGDIVKVDKEMFPNREFSQAKQLLTPGLFPDRNYFEFQFKATLQQLPIDKTTIEKYKQEIERIKIEKSMGQFFYPQIIETINMLANFANE